MADEHGPFEAQWPTAESAEPDPKASSDANDSSYEPSEDGVGSVQTLGSGGGSSAAAEKPTRSSGKKE